MKVSFPYSGYESIEPVEVPDPNLLGVYSPRAAGNVNEEEILVRAFAAPFGAPRLREAVKSSDRVLVLVDDGTRGTPDPALAETFDWRVVGSRCAGSTDPTVNCTGNSPPNDGDGNAAKARRVLRTFPSLSTRLAG